jgi:hypothetical protein
VVNLNFFLDVELGDELFLCNGLFLQIFQQNFKSLDLVFTCFLEFIVNAAFFHFMSAKVFKRIVVIVLRKFLSILNSGTSLIILVFLCNVVEHSWPEIAFAERTVFLPLGVQ